MIIRPKRVVLALAIAIASPASVVRRIQGFDPAPRLAFLRHKGPEKGAEKRTQAAAHEKGNMANQKTEAFHECIHRRSLTLPPSFLIRQFSFPALDRLGHFRQTFDVSLRTAPFDVRTDGESGVNLIAFHISCNP